MGTSSFLLTTRKAIRQNKNNQVSCGKVMSDRKNSKKKKLNIKLNHLKKIQKLKTFSQSQKPFKKTP